MSTISEQIKFSICTRRTTLAQRVSENNSPKKEEEKKTTLSDAHIHLRSKTLSISETLDKYPCLLIFLIVFARNNHILPQTNKQTVSVYLLLRSTPVSNMKCQMSRLNCCSYSCYLRAKKEMWAFLLHFHWNNTDVSTSIKKEEVVASEVIMLYNILILLVSLLTFTIISFYYCPGYYYNDHCYHIVIPTSIFVITFIFLLF